MENLLEKTRWELLCKAEKEFGTQFTLELARELQNGESSKFWEEKLRKHFAEKEEK